MADSTAMTIDFLRARLLSERSVSRTAKERADELADRVAELEEQVREVTAQRRQAERAATEVLTILESQGFGGHLSDADDDSGSDQDSRGDTLRAPAEEEVAAAQGEAEDALSGTAQPGELSWKGRSVSPRKARQLRQKHRRSYFYKLSSSSDSSPKYRMGQSCRKNKRQMVMSNDGRSVSPGQDAGYAVAAESQKGRQDGSDCTYDGQDHMDGEVSGDERSSGDGSGGQYVIRYEKEMERQAELIEQYDEEEKTQREWEKQYNESRNADKAAAEVEHKPCQTREGREDCNPVTSQAAHKVLPKGSLSESPQNTSQENGGAQLREVNDKPDQSCAQTASDSAQESSNTSSTVTRQDEISDGESCFNGNARPSRRCAIKTPSERSTSSDTLNSKVSDWSSPHFHDHTDSQLDTQSYRPVASSSNNVDVGSVLEALQRARISLRAKLSRPVPPSQVTLALPAPGDGLKECDDLPADDDSNSYGEERSSSSPARQVILALPAPGDDHRREIDEYLKIPVCSPGLFRLPTYSFPADMRMFASGNVCGSGYGLAAAATRHATGSFSSNPSAHDTSATDAPSTSGDGSGFSAQRYYDLYSSVPTAGKCNSTAGPDFTIRDTSLLSGVPGLGDADLFISSFGSASLSVFGCSSVDSLRAALWHSR